jgi:histone arginine demethylase JMJD6
VLQILPNNKAYRVPGTSLRFLDLEARSVNDSIERRANLSYDEFASKYLFANKPVVMTDAIRSWKALAKWTPEFFKREFGDLKFTIDEDLERLAHGKAGSAVEYTMAQFIDRVLDSHDENPAPYFRNRVLKDVFPSLYGDIEPLPVYFEPNWLHEKYLVKRVGEVLNRGAALEIYIGGKGGNFPVLHYDGAGTHAFLMQVYGRKRIVLYPPEQECFLYPLPEKANLSRVDRVDSPDLERFPLFANAVPIVFELHPGETAFIPSHWWHTVKMLSPSITVSANVVNQSNWSELVRFVAARRRNRLVSVASRVYLRGAGAWRSWRDRDWRKRAA